MTSYDTRMANDPYLTPYRESAKEHGTDFKVTLWASKESQYRRFRAFTEMCFLAGKRVLDAGCSRGDFAQYLLERNIPFEHYIGIDGLDEVIDYARNRGLPGTEFHAGDMLLDASLFRIGNPQVICISDQRDLEVWCDLVGDRVAYVDATGWCAGGSERC